MPLLQLSLPCHQIITKIAEQKNNFAATRQNNSQQISSLLWVRRDESDTYPDRRFIFRRVAYTNRAAIPALLIIAAFGCGDVQIVILGSAAT